MVPSTRPRRTADIRTSSINGTRNCVSFEDSFPLRRRDSWGGVMSDLDKKRGFGNVSIVCSQKPTGFFATGVARTGGRVGRSFEPRHVWFWQFLSFGGGSIVSLVVWVGEIRVFPGIAWGRIVMLGRRFPMVRIFFGNSGLAERRVDRLNLW